jgi:hypothetical protein
MKNKFKGYCCGCRKTVEPFQGLLESQRSGRRNIWVVWCPECYDKSDHSSHEDRQCGDRAYEDQCAKACGLDSL